ncbi:MAG: response regulator [Patescibacteria group bacterium]
MKDELSKKKNHNIVILVEDDEAIVKVLMLRMRQESMNVVLARDGEEGLEACEKHRPSLVLLDLIMPKMDGITMLKELREKPWGKKIPVIVLTNLTHPEKEAEAKALHVLDYIVKTDIEINALIERIKTIIK